MSISLKIKRQENVFYSSLYRAGKFMRGASLPVFRPIHLPLYHLNALIREYGCRLVHAIWTVPLFKARCEQVGRGLALPDGMPLVTGGHLRLRLGDHVTICRSTIGSSKAGEAPVLQIGDHSSIGYGTTISVSREVSIGDHCMISINCLIMDSDDHPVDPFKRQRKMPVDPEDIKPVRIGNNVWVGAHSAILKGVTIGENSIVGTHSVVTRDVPDNSICVGNPAKIIKREINIPHYQPQILELGVKP